MVNEKPEQTNDIGMDEVSSGNGEEEHKRCASDSCEETVPVESEDTYCEACKDAQHKADFPIDGVQRITEGQLRQWLVLEEKKLNDQQKVRILNLEIDQLRRQFDQTRLNTEIAINKKVEERGTVEGELVAKEAQHTALMQQIAQEHKVENYKDLVIDDETRVVRDGSAMTGSSPQAGTTT